MDNITANLILCPCKAEDWKLAFTSGEQDELVMICKKCLNVIKLNQEEHNYLKEMYIQRIICLMIQSFMFQMLKIPGKV